MRDKEGMISGLKLVDGDGRSQILRAAALMLMVLVLLSACGAEPNLTSNPETYYGSQGNRTSEYNRQ